MPIPSLPRAAASLALALAFVAAACPADDSLDAVLDSVAPELRKWAVVCLVSERDGVLDFDWRQYRDSGIKTDFWPASCIKLYAAVAALELLTERAVPMDCVLRFEHQKPAGRWQLDCARSLREMLSEIFRRSSNEDYTLLLRLVGIDRINTQFLTPERGFPSSALMRGYVSGRPWRYERDERQQITIEAVFPTARFFHKGGLISNYALEVALVDDRVHSGKCFLLVPVVNAGQATKPLGGEALVGAMSRAIAEWVRAQP